MTSEERRANRRARREQKRQEKKNKYQWADTYSIVFSYEHLYQAYKCCRRGVGWKSSVQRYISNAPRNVYRTWNELRNNIFRSPGFHEFDLYERGKHRHIRSTVIKERVVQRCLCDYCLIPKLERTFIYDNGASMKNKGYDFAISRLEHHLHKHYRKYKTKGYILLFDFSKFFDNISHAVVKKIVCNEITDQQILNVVNHLIDAFGDIGLGLGSQISQVLALASANRLDHYIKEVLRIKGYGRYMDDGYLIHHSKEFLRYCLIKIKEICEELGIQLNTKKTQIVKLSHGFTWLKVRFYLTETGKIVKKIYRRSIHVMRRKLKKFYQKLQLQQMTFEDVWTSWQSWRSYAARFNAWHTIMNMGKLYDLLFIIDWRNNHVLQSNS